MTHEHDHGTTSHSHAHGHGHGHGESAHSHSDSGEGHGHGGADTAAPGTAQNVPLDRDRLLILLRNWVDHNEGHRRSYLEWRDRLTDEGLPATTAAMGRLADLAQEANTALHGALDELGRQ